MRVPLQQERQTLHFSRHRGPVTCAACVPGDANSIITAGYDGAVGIVDVRARQMALLGYHAHLVNRIAVSPSGRLAASASSDHTINIWDLSERRLVRRLCAHSDDVEDFVFIDDGVGVSASRDRRALQWDLSSGAVLRQFPGHERDVLSVAYSRGRLFTSGDDMTLRVWSVSSGQLLYQWGPFAYETDTCAVDPVHDRVVLGCDDGVLRVFAIATGAVIKEVAAHGSGIKMVSTSPTTGDILTAAYDRRVLVWDSTSLEVRKRLASIATVWERSFNWSQDGTRVVAGTFDGTVVGWTVDTGEQEFEIGESGGNPCLNDVSTAGELAATVADDGYLRLSRLSHEGAKWISRTAPLAGRVLANAVSADADAGVVLTGGHDGVLRTFSLTPGTRELSRVSLGQGPINCVRLLSANGGYEAFVACYSGCVIRLKHTQEITGRWKVHSGAVKALRLIPSLELGVSCSADGTARSWSLATGETHVDFPGHTAIINDLDVDSTGSRLVTVARDFTANVYLLSTGQLIKTVALARRSPKAVLFASDNAILVGDYWGYLVQVPLNGDRPRSFRIASNGISALARRSDGYAVASSYDGSLLLLDVVAHEVLAAAHAMTQHLVPPTLATDRLASTGVPIQAAECELFNSPSGA